MLESRDEMDLLESEKEATSCDSFDKSVNRLDRLVRLVEAEARLFSRQQGPNESLSHYCRAMVTLHAAAKRIGATLHDHALAQHIATEKGRDQPNDQDKVAAEKESLAMLFILGARDTSYLMHLRNSYLEGRDCYPATIQDAYHRMQQRMQTNGSVSDSTSQSRSFCF